MRMRNWRGVSAARNQASEVRHVYQINCADFIGDLPHAREIDDARKSAPPADDHLRTLFFGKLFEVVVIDGLGFLGYSVWNNAIGLSGEVEMEAVRKVPAVGQIQTENGVPGLQHRGVRFHVGL